MSNLIYFKQIVAEQTVNDIWIDQLSTSFACKFSSVNHTLSQYCLPINQFLVSLSS
jgi:hypothetical protein